MNLRDLKYLVAVADHRHFARAASACHISQPTLSMQLKKLEETLGVTLIERRRSNILLTDIGQLVVEAAREILQNVDDLVMLAHSRRDDLSGTVTLGAFPTIAPYLFSSLAPKMGVAFPDIAVHLVEEKTPILLEKLKKGTLDAAFLALPLDEDSLRAVPIFDDPFFLAVSHKHPLKQRSHLSVDDLGGLTLLLLEDGHCLRDQALSVCATHQSQEYPKFRATSLETLRQMVAMNPALATLMPRSAIPALYEHNPIARAGDPLHYLSIDPAPTRTLALVYRRTHPRRAFFAAFLTFLQKNVATWF